MRYPFRPVLSALLLPAMLLCQAPALAHDVVYDDDDGDDDDHHERDSRFILALDGELSAVANQGSEPLGGGIGVRMGRHFPFLGVLAFRPEIGGGYNRLLDYDTGRAFAGARLGFNFIVGAYVYGHAGVGWGAPDTNFMYDVGGAVDLLVFNFFRPGVHLEYERIVNNIETVNGGIHFEFAF